MNDLRGDSGALVNSADLQLTSCNPKTNIAAVAIVATTEWNENESLLVSQLVFMQYLSAVLQQNCTLAPFCTCQVLARYLLGTSCTMLYLPGTSATLDLSTSRWV